MKKKFAFFCVLSILLSCSKDTLLETENQYPMGTIRALTENNNGGSNYLYDSLEETIPNYDVLVRATSLWIGTTPAKEWIMNFKTEKNRRIDEILLLEILCSDEGDNFIASYNQVAEGNVSKEILSSDLESVNKMLCLKIDYVFEKYIADLSNYTPVITYHDMEVGYLNGGLFDPVPVLSNSGADAVVHFKISEAANTVLFNPASHTFNIPLFYETCDDATFYDKLLELADPICSGEIALSIAYDIQDLFNDICGGVNPPNFLPVEQCNNGIDDDEDGLVDCEDPDCCWYVNCNCSEVEICNNGIDDDNDGLIDSNDPDCWEGTSPCMRDHYLEDNYFYELELQEIQQITGMGGNLCGGVINLANPVAGGIGYYGQLYNLSNVGTATALEEWYNFHIKIHWGSATSSQGFFQDLVYYFHLFDLVNEPETTGAVYYAGTSGTGGGAGVLLITVHVQGLNETKPASLNLVRFFGATDICGLNNWDPGVLGDNVAFYIHEIDGCRLNQSDGTVSSIVTTETKNSSFNINLGLPANIVPLTGGVLYQNSNSMATSNTNSVNSNYNVSYVDLFDCGKINYFYCWSDQGTLEQIHNVPFANILTLRTMVKACN